MSPKLCKFILKSMGWTCIGTMAPVKNCVILEAPHTSIWDFAIGYLYYGTMGGHLRVMIKKESFFFPFGYLLKALGGFPINRTNPNATIVGIIHEMESSGEKPFHLVICPEGTRKAVHKWKTGYHTIATSAGIPVYLSCVDWGAKRTGIFAEYKLKGSAREDTEEIQKIYDSMGFVGKYPEGYVTR